MSADERSAGAAATPAAGRTHPLSDQPLLDVQDALVNDRGRVAAAEALGVNYRTMMACYDSRRVSRRMRQALAELRDSAVFVDDGGAEAGGGDDGAEDEAEPLGQRVAALEAEGRGLREMIEAQTGQLGELGCWVAWLEEPGQQRGDAQQTAVESLQGVWRPPRRGHGLPDAGVVTLEEQPDEEHAFGPAAALVAEWRALRAGGEAVGSRVDRARTGMRWWELETAMLRDFHLTLPPGTEPLDEAGRADHLRWRTPVGNCQGGAGSLADAGAHPGPVAVGVVCGVESGSLAVSTSIGEGE